MLELTAGLITLLWTVGLAYAALYVDSAPPAADYGLRGPWLDTRWWPHSTLALVLLVWLWSLLKRDPVAAVVTVGCFASMAACDVNLYAAIAAGYVIFVGLYPSGWISGWINRYV